MALNFEESLYNKLKTTASITALCSTRIYPLITPQGAIFPHVVYQRVSSNKYHSIGGDTGEISHNYQIDIYAETYSGVKALAEKIRLTLQNFNGLLYTNGVTVKAVLMLNETDDFDEEAKIYRVMQEYSFMYKETI